MNQNRLGRSAFALLLALAVPIGAAWAQDTAADETPVAAAAPEVKVEMAFGTGVDRVERALEGEAASFAAAGFTAESGQVFCLTKLTNVTSPATVTHVWYHEGTTMARVDLEVGAATWRTWSSKRILPSWTGAWEVKVLDADGMVLATGGFTVN